MGKQIYSPSLRLPFLRTGDIAQFIMILQFEGWRS